MAADEPDVVLLELARLVAHSGYLAYTNTLIGGAPPATQACYKRMANPTVGDVVLEVSTYHREPWNPGALGRLVSEGMEPWSADDDEAGLEHVWYVKPFMPTEDGSATVRWTNARFIALPDQWWSEASLFASSEGAG